MPSPQGWVLPAFTPSLLFKDQAGGWEVQEGGDPLPENLDLLSPKVYPIHPLRHTIPVSEKQPKGKFPPCSFQAGCRQGSYSTSPRTEMAFKPPRPAKEKKHARLMGFLWGSEIRALFKSGNTWTPSSFVTSPLWLF